MSKRYLVLPDVQAPFEDRKAVKAFIRFLGDYQPDELVCIGDLVDYPQPSRWNKGTVGEFIGSVKEDSEYVKRTILARIREVYDGPFSFLEGNHDERPRVYLEKYAPALAEFDAFHINKLLDFDGFGVDWQPEFYEFAPGWLMTHGHRGGIRLNQNAGSTALNAAIKMKRSVIMGHTHRLAMAPRSYGYGGKVTETLYGVEVGNLMDMKQAGYLKGGTANWQQGFVTVHVDGRHVRPQTVPIMNKRFIVEGVTYAV